MLLLFFTYWSAQCYRKFRTKLFYFRHYSCGNRLH